MTVREILQDIVEQIRKANKSKDGERIPTSDDLVRLLSSEYALDTDTIRYYLRVLSDAHYIITIHFVEADERLMISGINGYVVAEPGIVEEVKSYAYRLLEQTYEAQFYRRKQATLIIREMMTDVKRYNNTPIGKALNAALMLQQYDSVIESHQGEFSDQWKSSRLAELLPGLNQDSNQAATTPVISSEDTFVSPDIESHRAVDSEAYRNLEKMDLSGSWGKAVNKYGVNFLLRIHLRKYEFDRIRKLIKQKKIARYEDLRFVRDSVRKMEDRTFEDPMLQYYQNDMTELRRLAQIKLNQITLARQQAGLADVQLQSTVANRVDHPHSVEETIAPPGPAGQRSSPSSSLSGYSMDSLPDLDAVANGDEDASVTLPDSVADSPIPPDLDPGEDISDSEAGAYDESSEGEDY
ncbi:MAG: hypothetical protein CMN76_05895 [Spirochaetaceae bacterium]|nr:hypothetical protein [Spirochaetaceae bacterium]